MSTSAIVATATYHLEDGSWWAEVKYNGAFGGTALGDNFRETRALVREQVEFLAEGREVDLREVFAHTGRPSVFQYTPAHGFEPMTTTANAATGTTSVDYVPCEPKMGDCCPGSAHNWRPNESSRLPGWREPVGYVLSWKGDAEDLGECRTPEEALRLAAEIRHMHPHAIACAIVPIEDVPS